MKWLKESIAKGEQLTELSAEAELSKLREAGENLSNRASPPSAPTDQTPR